MCMVVVTLRLEDCEFKLDDIWALRVMFQPNKEVQLLQHVLITFDHSTTSLIHIVDGLSEHIYTNAMPCVEVAYRDIGSSLLGGYIHLHPKDRRRQWRAALHLTVGTGRLHSMIFCVLCSLQRQWPHVCNDVAFEILQHFTWLHSSIIL